MVVGVPAPYDTNGSQTADLVHNGWPRRPGSYRGPLARQFDTTTANYGVGVACHAAQSYAEPCKAAGQSKRISAAYQKTGVLSHRCEEGFRDTRAACTLTEAPANFVYGTMRQTLRGTDRVPAQNTIHGTGTLPSAGNMVLRVPSPTGSQRSGQSQRSRASSHRSKSSKVPSRTSDSISSCSHGRNPNWFQDRCAPWNFEPLPMYERTNQNYGKVNQSNFRGLDHSLMPPAGKSESGWLETDDLVRTLTRV
eukprot:CAMPEP_0169151478 /NCGR_PEP_ID=MMETSP1015-20121227/50855_1 /TAXON_ID=342587 /ORGANISM="Karlodinium micrum, Strain CCMP2283" /LENGTH=250 /DNA_ID=CAMNT_0009220915 /DNA_START=48 /DNA_END=800 /DNA_ORIENTATION=+